MRVTNQQLEYLISRINEVTGSPAEPWTEGKANVGNYHLDFAYGGVAIGRMCNESGGMERVSTQGFGTKRQAYDWMDAFLRGLEAAK